jgi:hypothetical protein
MKTTKRLLTVLEGFRPSYVGVAPRIHLEGRYLEKSGFAIGDKVAMIVEPGHISISVEPKYQEEKIHREILDFTGVRYKHGDVIVQFQQRGIWRNEIIRTAADKQHYRLTSVPVKISGLALGDLVSAEEQFGMLFYLNLVQPGPNLTIQVRYRDSKFADEQLLRVVPLCGCKAAHIRASGITINAPRASDYRKLIEYLDHGVGHGYWEYRKPSQDLP